MVDPRAENGVAHARADQTAEQRAAQRQRRDLQSAAVFAVVSLSDRLTPWETIEKRLLCAAEADLTIVLYNPASHGRPEHLHRACGILLRVLPEDRLCGIVRCIGREGESRRVLTLGELKTAQADMFCTVFIGNAAAQAVGGNWENIDEILTIAVVGTRRCTEYGSRTARQISADLAARGVITSIE